MNARHDVQAFAPADEPTPEEQREFFEWCELVRARDVLREGIRRGDLDAIRFGQEVTQALKSRPCTPRGHPPMAMLANDHHPGPRCSCRDCLREYPASDGRPF